MPTTLVVNLVAVSMLGSLSTQQMVEQEDPVMRSKPRGQRCNLAVYSSRKHLVVGSQPVDDIIDSAIVRQLHLERRDTLRREAPKIAP